MSTCVAKAATALVEPTATSVTGQDDAYKISVDEISYTKCFDNERDCTSASFSKEARCFKFRFKAIQFNQHTSYQGLCCTKG